MSTKCVRVNLKFCRIYFRKRGIALLLNQKPGLWRNTSTRCRARREHRHKLHHQDQIPRSSLAGSWPANAIVITHIISARVIMFHITMARSSIRQPRLNPAAERCSRDDFGTPTHTQITIRRHVYSFSMLLRKRRVIKPQCSTRAAVFVRQGQAIRAARMVARSPGKQFTWYEGVVQMRSG